MSRPRKTILVTSHFFIRRKLWALLVLIVTGLAADADLAQSAEPIEFSTEDLEFFERQVRPILVERCYECHSGQNAEPKGGLRLDSRSAILSGGDTGPAVDSDQPPEKSLLIDAVNYGDLYQMPPKSRLPDDEIAVLTKWVARGLPWPAETVTENAATKAFDLEGRKDSHWCWQPIVPRSPPEVQDTGWVRQELDRFILAKLEQAGLKPAAPADKRTLIRRVYFDLIGLPPTPDEVNAFLADESPQAFERVVDRLLESPHFGEKWARHWMDLVRYAETCGHEFDYPIANAWRYRDYLIRSFNDDLPYDQFVVEHIAGDLLPVPRRNSDGTNESIQATAFWFLHEAIHAPVDARGDQALRVDNQIDVFSKTFLGLTVSCARCHDHKFDAISTKDYYSLAGFLHSSRRQHAMLDPGGQIRNAAERISRLRGECESLIRDYFSSLSDIDANQFAQRLLAAREVVFGMPVVSEQDVQPGHRRSLDAVARQFGMDREILASWVQSMGDPEIATAGHPLRSWKEFAWRETDLASTGITAGSQAIIQEHSENSEAYVRFADFDRATYETWSAAGEAFDAGPSTSGRLCLTQPGVQLLPPEVAHSGQLGPKFHGVLRSPTFTVTHPNIFYRLSGKSCEVRLIVDGYTMIEFHTLLFGGLKFAVDSEKTYTWHRQAGDLGMYLGHRAYIEILDHGDGWAAIDEICFASSESPPPETAPSPPSIATSIEDHARQAGQSWVNAREHLCAGSATEADTHLLNWLLRHAKVFGPSYVAVELKIAALRAEIDRLAAATPPPERMTAIIDGSGEDLQVYIRGNHKTLGEPAPRQMLTALGGTRCDSVEGSGRLLLAQQLIDSHNPLTARVAVNRLWHHMLGRGIVPSVDNFGVLGEPPSHPELLDFLASQFVRDGWSIKRCVKRLAMSSTYQMSSVPLGDAMTKDPANRLFHSMLIRRLPGEAIRDSALAVSGQLDRTILGPSIPIHLTSFMQGRGRPQASGPLDGSRRRSIYTEVRRNFLSPLLLAFDMPVPFSTVGRRNVSNVPAQALILMNDPFFIQQAEQWAKSLLADQNQSFEQRVQDAYLAAYSRLPTDAELSEARTFFEHQAAALAVSAKESETNVRVWADYCHVLMNVKEFSFIQ